MLGDTFGSKMDTAHSADGVSEVHGIRPGKKQNLECSMHAHVDRLSEFSAPVIYRSLDFRVPRQSLILDERGLASLKL